MKVSSWRGKLGRKQKGWSGEYPVGTILFYGPDDRRATKVVAGALYSDRGDNAVIERWASETMDVRMDPGIGREVMKFFARHGVKHVTTTPGLAGCPHEEGIDYPEGGTCPRCPFWADRNRWETAARPAMPPGPMSN